MSTEGLKAALDKTKQIVALSTGVVTLSITFYDKIGSKYNEAVIHVPLSLKVAWILFGVTIVFGIWTNGSLTTIILVPAIAMDITFLLAMGFSIVGAVMVGW